MSLDPGPQGKGEGLEIELINCGQWCNQSQLCNVKVTQSGPTLCNPMDYTVHGILQAGILEWVFWVSLEWVSLLQGIFPTQESNQSLLHCRWIIYQLSYQESPKWRLHKNSKWQGSDSSQAGGHVKVLGELCSWKGHGSSACHSHMLLYVSLPSGSPWVVS